jgi:hypothetical protein
MKWFISFVCLAGMTATGVQAEGPPLVLLLGDRHAHAVPDRTGCTHLGGGNIDVDQPSPETVVISMTGAAVATGHPFCPSHAGMDFQLDQDLKIVFADPEKVKAAKLTMDARIIGLLRSKCGCHDAKSSGTASCSPACAELTCDGTPLLSVCAPLHQVGGGENLSVNCQTAPPAVPVSAGCYHLHAAFHIDANHPQTPLPCKPASAEFAPDALNEK